MVQIKFYLKTANRLSDIGKRWAKEALFWKKIYEAVPIKIINRYALKRNQKCVNMAEMFYEEAMRLLVKSFEILEPALKLFEGDES